MWLRTVDSLDHNMGLWCEPQSDASFAELEARAARLLTRPLVCRCYIQWLCSVCAACGTYVVNWMYFIISEQMVIILYIKVIQLALMCYCKRRKCIPLSIYTLMTSLLMS
jgi:membrane protein YdbS with pleckstrin-like domain